MSIEYLTAKRLLAITSNGDTPSLTVLVPTRTRNTDIELLLALARSGRARWAPSSSSSMTAMPRPGARNVLAERPATCPSRFGSCTARSGFEEGRHGMVAVVAGARPTARAV